MADLRLLCAAAGALIAGSLAGWLFGERERRRERATWKEAVERASAEARTDPLTGLRNRRAFDEQVPIQAAIARRYGNPLALVLIDIDGLKRVNDRGGHEAGDAVLRQLADQLRHGSREADLAMRIGGDEFALLLPQTDLAGSIAVATRLLGQFPAARTSSERPAPVAEWSISLGAAAYRAEESVADFLRRADEALYRAKQAGGRQIAAHDGTEAALQRSIDRSIL